MSKDKYPTIFSMSNGGYCMHYPSDIFRNTSGFENWGIFNNYSSLANRTSENIRSRDVFRPIAHKR